MAKSCHWALVDSFTVMEYGAFRWAWEDSGGLGGTRTPDALLRTEALYPLSYEAASHPL